MMDSEPSPETPLENTTDDMTANTNNLSDNGSAASTQTALLQRIVDELLALNVHLKESAGVQQAPCPQPSCLGDTLRNQALQLPGTLDTLQQQDGHAHASGSVTPALEGVQLSVGEPSPQELAAHVFDSVPTPDVLLALGRHLNSLIAPCSYDTEDGSHYTSHPTDELLQKNMYVRRHWILQGVALVVPAHDYLATIGIAIPLHSSKEPLKYRDLQNRTRLNWDQWPMLAVGGSWLLWPSKEANTNSLWHFKHPTWGAWKLPALAYDLYLHNTPMGLQLRTPIPARSPDVESELSGSTSGVQRQCIT